MNEEKKKVLPLGEDDFRTVIEEGYYYIDKSLFVKDFFDYKNKLSLITRPRRFGKTLNMTMLRDFLDITQDSRAIFDGLAIMSTEYANRINTVPVISLSLKGCTGKSVEKIEASIAEEVFKEYRKYEKILDQVDKKESTYLRFFQVLKVLRNEEDKPIIEHIREKLTYIENSLAYLAEALHTFYGVRPIVLIDEYDAPIIEAHVGGFRKAFTDFYATFLTTALKGNVHVAQAILTGIQRVAKESIFSKLNNVIVYSVLNERYAPYFGLTTHETKKLLEDFGLELNDDVKSRYDGYVFSNVEIYNPWSILGYANEKVLKNYWIKTSTNALVQESVLEADAAFHRAFETLIKEGTVKVRMNLEASFAELPRTDTLWGLFVNAGYLTVTHQDYILNRFIVRIPNEEIKSEFEEIVSAYTRLSSQTLQDMLVALMDGAMDDFFSSYKTLVLESTSCHDSKENAYHMLMLGMVMNLRDLYDITSNIESGHGRSDIMMKSKDAKRPHLVLEFKQGANVEKLKYKALAQIEEKKYYTGLTGEVLCVGIAHDKKRCELVSKMLTV